jgi:predicted nucleic acid-binding protein
VAVIGDTSAIYALYDADDAGHPAARATIEGLHEVIRIPAPILAEIDYLLRARLGQAALLSFLDDVLEGAFVIEELETADWLYCRSLLERYASMDLGLADSCVASLADRRPNSSIFTFDRRDFSVMRRKNGKPFKLIPA